jgi:decaprenylphospho-beta-D-ribofuranose 2-oxidase
MRSTTQALVGALNEFVIAEGGRIYLAKDAVTRAAHFRAMEPRVDAFLATR